MIIPFLSLLRGNNLQFSYNFDPVATSTTSTTTLTFTTSLPQSPPPSAAHDTKPVEDMAKDLRTEERISMFLRNFGMHLQVHIEFKSRRTKPES
jgi:hypothetical protein